MCLQHILPRYLIETVWVSKLLIKKKKYSYYPTALDVNIGSVAHTRSAVEIIGKYYHSRNKILFKISNQITNFFFFWKYMFSSWQVLKQNKWFIILFLIVIIYDWLKCINHKIVNRAYCGQSWIVVYIWGIEAFFGRYISNINNCNRNGVSRDLSCFHW